MTSFLAAMLRAAGAGARKAARVLMRRPRNMALAVLALVMAGFVGLVVISTAGSLKQQASAAASAAAAASAPSNVVAAATATPVPGTATGANATKAGSPVPGTAYMGASPQAVDTASPIPSATPTAVPAPVKPSPDRSRQEEVARAWAQAYFTRPAGKFTDWQGWVAPYVDPLVLDHLTTDEYRPNAAFDGTQATATTDVRFGPSDGSTGRDTPVRWSRAIDIDVVLADGHTYTITYILDESLRAEGWVIDGAQKKTWTLKH